jgi:hypothetical protein
VLLLQLDKVAADAAEFKAGYDKLTADNWEQKAQVRREYRASLLWLFCRVLCKCLLTHLLLLSFLAPVHLPANTCACT